MSKIDYYRKRIIANASLSDSECKDMEILLKKYLTEAIKSVIPIPEKYKKYASDYEKGYSDGQNIYDEKLKGNIKTRFNIDLEVKND